MKLVSGIHHVSILVGDTERSLGFYRNILGLEVDPSRPDLGYPGAWLWAGQQQIHLLELKTGEEPDRLDIHGGRDRHMALMINDLDTLSESLEVAGVAYTRSRSGRRALFFRDPDGNAIECVEMKPCGPGS